MDNILDPRTFARGKEQTNAIAVDHVRPRAHPEQFLLSATREWRVDWDCWERGAPRRSPLPQSFRELGAAEALPDFIEALEILYLSARRALDIREPGSQTLSTDEETLLTVCRLAQAGSEPLVMASLTVIMLSGARRVCSLRLASAMAQFASAGVYLPAPALRLPPRRQ